MGMKLISLSHSLFQSHKHVQIISHFVQENRTGLLKLIDHLINDYPQISHSSCFRLIIVLKDKFDELYLCSQKVDQEKSSTETNVDLHA